MRFCLKCRRLNAAGAQFCAYGCGALGGARCSNGHLVPMLAVPRVCSFCGSPDVVPAVPSINLKLVTRVLAWALGLLIIHLGFLNLESLGLSAWNILSWTVGRELTRLVLDLLTLALALKVFVWLIGLVNPDAAKSLELLDRLLPWLVKALAKGLVSLFRLFMWLAEGKPMKSSKASNKGDEKR